MEWFELFGSNTQPTNGEISQFINSPQWENLINYLQAQYEIIPKISFSGCSGQPGWNIKYQKSGRSLCTLYPMEGYFIALVVIGVKEEEDVELIKSSLNNKIQELLSTTSSIMGGRWLMIPVTNEKILEDVKTLIKIRMPRRK